MTIINSAIILDALNAHLYLEIDGSLMRRNKLLVVLLSGRDLDN